MSRNKYTREFKKEVVFSVIVDGLKLKSAAQQFNISHKTIESWVRKEKKNKGYYLGYKEGTYKSDETESEVTKLTIENSNLLKQVDILKQTISCLL